MLCQLRKGCMSTSYETKSVSQTGALLKELAVKKLSQV